MREIVFEVTQEQDGGYTAEAIRESIFTEADTWQELRANAQEAVEAFFFDQPKPDHIRLHLVRERSARDRMKLPHDLSGNRLADFNTRP